MKTSQDTFSSLIMVGRHISSRYIYHPMQTDWGGSLLIMELSGCAFARLYWFHDDSTVAYLDWLSVRKDMRNRGIATQLQEMREEMARKLGVETVMLWVKKNTWMHKWYQRRGYKDWKDHRTEENAIWMKKSIRDRK